MKIIVVSTADYEYQRYGFKVEKINKYSRDKYVENYESCFSFPIGLKAEGLRTGI